MEASRKGPGENRPKSSLEAEIVMCGPRFTGQGCLSAEGCSWCQNIEWLPWFNPKSAVSLGHDDTVKIVPTLLHLFLLLFFLLLLFNFLKKLKKIFIWLHRVLVAWHRLFLMSTWASLVALCGFNCLPTCGILVPGLGIEPTSPALEGGFLTTGPAGEPLFY